MRCAGCQRELEVGDRYIKDSPSGFIGKESDPKIDALVAGVMTGTLDSTTGESGEPVEMYFCEDCTVSGGDYLFETVYGDEDE